MPRVTGACDSPAASGGYGNVLEMAHTNGIVTVYGHLSRFAKGRAQRARRVSQGEIIGYVGRSGLATGPHLHYEYRVNGVHKNPQTVELPDAAPIESGMARRISTRSLNRCSRRSSSLRSGARLALSVALTAASRRHLHCHTAYDDMAAFPLETAMDSPDLKAPELYINRELSLLEFNQRVLAQALDESVPLLERLRFLCISSSNLDEFFEIRVAGLKQLLELGSRPLARDGLSIAEQLAAIHERALRRWSPSSTAA